MDQLDIYVNVEELSKKPGKTKGVVKRPENNKIHSLEPNTTGTALSGNEHIHIISSKITCLKEKTCMWKKKWKSERAKGLISCPLKVLAQEETVIKSKLQYVHSYTYIVL